MEYVPLVSVITGYYNRKEGLKESIQSVLDQSYKNFEFLVFDDCSNDGTYELLMQFNDPRLKIFRHETNTGFTQGMKDTIGKAKGEYIAVHGAGDISLPDRLEKQVKVLEENADIVVVGCFYNNYNPVSLTEEKVRMKALFTRADVFNKTPISHGGATFRKQQYDAVGGYRAIFKYVQDGELWLRLTTLGNIYAVQEVLYQRNVFADGVSFSTKKTIQQAKYSLLARDINELPADKQQEVIDKCTKEGVDSVLSYKDERIQKILFKKFHSVLDVHDAGKLNEFIENSTGIYKAYYSLVIYGYKFKAIKNLLNFMQYKIYKPAKLNLKKLIA